MTHAKIARALGMSKTTVRLLEQTGLEKIARGLGVPPPKRPRWMLRFLRDKSGRINTVKHSYHCSRCGEEGHSRRGCRP
jgi:hypothetical protein